ncbi:DUF421 domain-containing protein [Roseivivax sediminis]|uniref:DUF421 domain-containing protein n=1 Tax=Roseivivax sediminis TaxID=936889 RepID=A0A1I1VL78_9RHOB|nr:YetF domain-containing protein [Roseivivax sediminis]SFD83574.1 Protein of unknown function [Roseivivax sediminis]
MIHDMLLDDATGLLRTIIVGPLAYAFLIAALRVSGKRTLAKLNAFDLVVTVALGSTLASVLTSDGVAFAEAATAFVTLIALQWIVATASVRSRRVAGWVRSEPVLLMRAGEVCEAALRRERITREELMTVIRRSDTSDPDAVAAVVLESDGSFSVIPRPEDGTRPDYARHGLPAAKGRE